ncbi:glycosyltransferase, partial [bacterium]|nr:glycosyltransferase [bacterium]
MSQATPSSAAPRVSVILPYHNARETLPGALASVLAAGAGGVEIVCVDDRSTEPADDIVAAAGARHVCLTRRSGAAAARNVGASMAEGEILLFLDADVTLEPDALDRILDVFADRKIDACFGAYTPLPGPANFASVYKNLVHHYTHLTSHREARTFWCGCGAIRASAFWAIGGFDESYEAASVEDIELGYRLTGAGGRIALDPSIRVRHEKRYTFAGLVVSDVLARAVPWTLLMARRRVVHADLNLKPANLLSALLLTLGAPAAIVTALHTPAIAAPLFTLVACAFALLNLDFLHFAARKKGLIFALCAGLMHAVQYLWATAGLLA